MAPGPILSGIDSVNTFNGNLSVHLPLLTVGGRGDAGYTMALAINSKKWHVRKVCLDPMNGCTSIKHIPIWDQTSPNYGPGALRYGYHVVGPVTGGGATCSGPESVPIPNNHRTLTRLSFTSPSGEGYTFRDERTGGQYDMSHCVSAEVIPFNRGTRFLSTDGSAATFESDQDVMDCNTNSCATAQPTGRLKLANGTVYRMVNGQVVEIRDRNGNLVQFLYGDSSGRLSSIKDSIGREVQIQYDVEQIPGELWADEISYLGAGGAGRTIRVFRTKLGKAFAPGSGYLPQYHDELFPDLDRTDGPFNPWVVIGVNLPNDLDYVFFYNPHAEIEQLRLPTGGRLLYEYAKDYQKRTDTSSYPAGRRVSKRSMYEGPTLHGQIIYGPSYAGNTTVTASTQDAIGTVLTCTRSQFYGTPLDVPPGDGLGEAPWASGRETLRETWTGVCGASTALQTVRQFWQQRITSGLLWPGDPQLWKVETTQDGLTTKKEFVYDAYHNTTQVKQFGFDGALLRQQDTSYIGATDYTQTAHLRRLPTQESVRDGLGGQASLTTYAYDETPLLARSNISRHEPAYGSTSPASPRRGNRTSTSRWLYDPITASATTLTTTQSYDVAGNVVAAKDSRGKTTTFSLDDNFGGRNWQAHPSDGAPAELEGKQAFAFVTKVENPKGQATWTQYDFHLGKPVETEDPNNILTSYTYAGNGGDLLDRLWRVIAADTPAGGEQMTKSLYDDVSGIVTQLSDRNSFGEPEETARKVQTLHDVFGRESGTVVHEDSHPGPDPDVITTKKIHDAAGRVSAVSNPYRTGEAVVWTTTTVDGLGRPLVTTHPGGGKTKWEYSSDQTTITDPAGKVRRIFRDALGLVVKVIEDPAGVAHATHYGYDGRDNLKSVTQGSQARIFIYDSLSRLRRATNPESGTHDFAYDGNGNLIWRRDARLVVTDYVYDDINRLISRSYSDGTPGVEYTYDTLPLGVGRLTSVASSVSTTAVLAYDAIGRVKQSRQTTDGRMFTFAYSYDRAGDLISETYPSGRVVQTTYTRDGQSSTTGQVVSGALVPYESNVDYAPHGGLRHRKLGNGLWESTTYNERLQPALLRLGSDQDLGNFWDLGNDFGAPTGNNGNVIGQTLKADGRTFTSVFSYDALNRLKTVSETSDVVYNGQPALSWSQAFAYDRFGNRAVEPGSAIPDPNLTQTSLAAFNAANRIAAWGYDNGGNVTLDGKGRTFGYDAESQQTNEGADTYAYDGEGRRVKRVTSEGTSLFAYDAVGRLASEVTTDSAEPVGTRYLTTDQIGSTRVVTSGTGTIVSRYDYLPFGEGVPVDPQQPLQYGGRIAISGYLADAAGRLKFTGKERDDNELDYFNARYYSGAQGRFTSADDPLIFGAPVDPQTWNLYAYTGNNPLNRIDLDGHDWFYANGQLPIWINCATRGGECAAQKEAGWTQWMPSEKGHRRLVDWMDGTFRLGVDADGNPTSSYTPEFLEPTEGPVEGIVSIMVGKALLSVPKAVPAQVTLNRAAGNAFRDEIADLMQKSGREVEIEVYKWTPFGKRFIDVEVKLKGKVLGGIETKVGGSRYTASQRAKDWWLRHVQKYPVNVVRNK